MTSIRIPLDVVASPDAGLPELPPLPIGALVAGTLNLLQDAADLPVPTSITIYDLQAITVHFARHTDSIRAIAQWARRFGSITTSHPGKVEPDTGTFHETEFSYYGIAVTAFAFIPAAPAATT